MVDGPGYPANAHKLCTGQWWYLGGTSTHYSLPVDKTASRYWVPRSRQDRIFLSKIHSICLDLTEQSFQFRMEGMKNDTEDVDLRSRMDDVARAIQALFAESWLSQIHNRHVISPKPTGFNVTLRCYRSEQHGSCGKQQELSVLLSQKQPTLLACLEELRSRIEQKHGRECAKAVETLESADETAQAFESAHDYKRSLFESARIDSEPASCTWIL